MAVDSRPVMTATFFEGEASYQDDGWWFTGEGLIHRNPLMQIEGWNVYGSPGYNQLTEAQQILMIWSDLVGQVSNGGFVQFVGNYESVVPLAHAMIPKLRWPELTQQFDRALTEQVGDPSNPKIWKPVFETRVIEMGDVQITVNERMLNEDEAPAEDEADAFNQWFYQDSTKEQSMTYVGAFVRRNRDQLCNIQN